MKKTKLIGDLQVPGDKSISHRVLMFSCFSKGITEIRGLSTAQDCASTANCLAQLGLKIEKKQDYISDKPEIIIQINSAGIHQLSAPIKTLYVGNSGTTIRIMSGIVAGRPFSCTFDGDDSIRRRPMARVLDQLERMGTRIVYESKPGLAPFTLHGGNLQGHDFDLKVASAQVQTALLLAGLQATGKTKVHLPGTARDHTTRLFAYMGIPFDQEGGSTSVEKLIEPVAPFKYNVPADISSAAFFMVAAACLPGSQLILKNIGMNPGRTLVIDVLKRMGAHINLLDSRVVANEEIANIEILGGEQLKGTTISGNEIASGVDEIPVLALAGSLCHGNFIVKDAEELRHKESDRLQLITHNLQAAGAEIKEAIDGFVISGRKKIKGGSYWKTHHDHRLAMSGLIANLLFDEPLNIEETNSIAVSYPNFTADLKLILQN